jgi:hypothetical protein
LRLSLPALTKLGRGTPCSAIWKAPRTFGWATRLFSFVYHSLAYLWGVSFAWTDAVVTSEFIPFLITDLPKVAIVRLVGGIHCTLVVAVGVGTIVSFFRRKLDDVRKSAEDMSKRLADQSVHEKYLLLEQKASLPVPSTPKV